MTRILAPSISFAMLALPALGASTIDPATITCKEYKASGHEEMVAIEDALYETMKNDPKLGKLGQSAFISRLYQVCRGNPDAKVIGVLH
ncbi:hypothetical protein NKG60_29680 [Mesorhizobium sp. M1428]|uniref:hypothetical protein n=1 Tax=Mesorhizobium sp. M1428 TaxID=2957102 RepID=UPI00333CD962